VGRGIVAAPFASGRVTGNAAARLGRRGLDNVEPPIGTRLDLSGTSPAQGCIAPLRI